MRTFAFVALLMFGEAQIDMSDLLGGLGGGGGGKGKKKGPLCGAGTVPVPKANQFSDANLYANGCGPTGMQVDEPFGLFKCCNGHDICYGICGASHKFCEKAFRICMKKVCKESDGKMQECTQQAESFSGMTKIFGSGFHTKGQQDACQCVDKSEARAAHKEVLLTFFGKYNQTAATEENVEGILEKYEKKGKMGEAYFKLAKKHGTEFVRFDNIKGEL
jgi:secretory phospholipase A2